MSGCVSPWLAFGLSIALVALVGLYAHAAQRLAKVERENEGMRTRLGQTGEIR